MLLYRVEHTFQTVDKLLVAVGSQMEPCVALYSYVSRYASHCKKFLAAEFLQLRLLLFQCASAVAQFSQALVADAFNYAVVLLEGKSCYEALCAGNML